MDKKSTSKKRKKINYNAKDLFKYYRKQKTLNNNKDVYSTELKNFVIKFIERTLPEYDGCNICGGEMTDMLLHDFYKNKISDKELIRFIIENSGINNFYLIEDDLEEIEKYNNIAIDILAYVVENILTKCSFVYDRIGCEFYITKDTIKEITEQLEEIGGKKHMKYTKCSNCGCFIPDGTKAYIGIDSAQGDVFCSEYCVVRYITSGTMVYVNSETDGELNWFETHSKLSWVDDK